MTKSQLKELIKTEVEKHLESFRTTIEELIDSKLEAV